MEREVIMIGKGRSEGKGGAGTGGKRDGAEEGGRGRSKMRWRRN